MTPAQTAIMIEFKKAKPARGLLAAELKECHDDLPTTRKVLVELSKLEKLKLVKRNHFSSMTCNGTIVFWTIS